VTRPRPGHGGRLADLVGRRLILVTGTALFGAASLAGGLAQDSGMLVGARLAQGLGGVLSAGPGWRWVLFVTLPVCALVLVAAFRLIDGGRPGSPGESAERQPLLSAFDTLGAVLGTGGMLLLIFALVRAPDDGWGAARTIGELAGAVALLLAFGVNEARQRYPLVPPSIFRLKGLAAVFVGVQTAANAGVPPALAGLASALINASFQVGAGRRREGRLGCHRHSRADLSRRVATMAQWREKTMPGGRPTGSRPSIAPWLNCGRRFPQVTFLTRKCRPVP